MQPNDGQLLALERIAHWFHDSRDQEFKLGGFAGTGKTFLMTMLPEFLGLKADDIRFVAPTNHACDVLENKLRCAGVLSPVSTLSSYIHRPKGAHCRSCPMAKPYPDRLAHCHVLGGKGDCGCGPDFQAKPVYDKPPLVVCDESSMVKDTDYDDLTRALTNEKLLFVGDPGQIGPMNRYIKDFNLMENPSFTLEKIERQDEDSAIPNIATRARKGLVIPYGQYGDDVVKISPTDPELSKLINPATFQAITLHRNPKTGTAWWTEHEKSVPDLNRLFREQMGFGKHPRVGERVMAVGVRGHRIYKGTIGHISEIEIESEYLYKIRVAIPGRAIDYSGVVYAPQFGANGAMERNNYDLWDYGYGITCNAAQGSEYDNVVIFEPNKKYRNLMGDGYRRWLYTAITRAKSQLVIVG